MKIRAIVTGATGMVGEGVLVEALQNPDVEKVLVLTRKSTGRSHPKMEELVHSDFHNLQAVDQRLKDYNACFFCLGVSSVGMKEDEYRRHTYDLTLNVAKTLASLNHDMTFCYVSGAGTDSTEKGRSMWARVKGKTENDLSKLPFKRALMFRPGFIEPSKGLKNTLKIYRYLGWLVPVFKTLAPSTMVSLQEIGRAMINGSKNGHATPILEIKDIKALAKDDRAVL